MTEMELVIGMRNKKGIIKKIKWYPNKVLIDKEDYDKYIELKERYEREKTIEEIMGDEKK